MHALGTNDAIQLGDQPSDGGCTLCDPGLDRIRGVQRGSRRGPPGPPRTPCPPGGKKVHIFEGI